MAFKIKQEKIAPEIESARSKLESALQYLMEKTDESPSTSEDECNKGLGDMIIKKEPSPISTPTKKPIQRVQRKRRRRDEGINKTSNSYVMKLFDRAVDLAPFTENDPLYPICRSWIHNQSSHYITSHPKQEPNNNIIESGEDSDKLPEDSSSEDIYQLPQPKPLDPDEKDLRIPSPIPQPEEKFIICSDDHNNLSKEMLLAKHMPRWKATRQKWKQAAKLNEDRYRESGAILKAMYERSQNRDATSETWNTGTPVS